MHTAWGKEKTSVLKKGKIFNLCNLNYNLAIKRGLKRFQCVHVYFNNMLKLELILESMCHFSL